MERGCPASARIDVRERWRRKDDDANTGSERYRAWAECAITGLTIVTEQPEALELMASLTRVEARRRKT
jgi:hypothetical protein